MDNAFQQTMINRLRTLNHTPKSISTTSRAFIKNRHMAKELVKLWFTEFRAAPENAKPVFLHLLNDVLINSVQRAPYFVQLFEPVLPDAFRETACIQSNQVRSAIASFLISWAKRKVYPRAFLRHLRSICLSSASQADMANPSKRPPGPLPFDFSFTCVLINACLSNSASGTPAPSGNNPTSPASPGQCALPSPAVQTQYVPKTTELALQLESLNSAPSADAETRERIAAFPPEISEPSAAAKMLTEGRIDSATLIERIQTALSQVESYNRSLEEEMEQRKTLSLALRAYRQALRESSQETLASIKSIEEKRAQMEELRERLDSHVKSLPDEGSYIMDHLLPLPSVGDLFR